MAIVTQATKFKVPREDNTALIWAQAPLLELLQSNAVTRSSYPVWLRELTEQSRRELAPLMLANLEQKFCCCSCAAHHGETPEKGRDSVQESSDQGRNILSAYWVLGGHQPELFHPGVWFKNFYLNWAAEGLAKQGENAIGLHLIVDHDLARSTSIRSTRIVNGRLLQASHVMPIAKSTASPWEATYFKQSDREAWERWLDDVIEDSQTLGIDPILQSRRGEFMNLLQESENIAEAFSRFRHLIEEANGIDNFELAMSRVASTQAFGEFLRRCLLDSHHFFEVYNSARDEFRQERGITNPAQPVPGLVRSGEWLELPFWIYCRDASSPEGNDVHRNKLWGRVLGNGSIQLADAPEGLLSHTLRLERDDWQDDWLNCIQLGICVRPRALTNTLFLRYVVADLFVHGIGGGIYDAVTDTIASRMWGLQPLAMQVVSAALYLPMTEQALAALPDPIHSRPEDHLRDLHRLRSSPESFLDMGHPVEAQLKSEHDRLLATRPAKGNRRHWHREMKKLREAIRTILLPRTERMQALGRGLAEQERQNRISRSRESSFVLFPESDIARRLEELLPAD